MTVEDSISRVGISELEFLAFQFSKVLKPGTHGANPVGT